MHARLIDHGQFITLGASETFNSPFMFLRCAAAPPHECEARFELNGNVTSLQSLGQKHALHPTADGAFVLFPVENKGVVTAKAVLCSPLYSCSVNEMTFSVSSLATTTTAYHSARNLYFVGASSGGVLRLLVCNASSPCFALTLDTGSFTSFNGMPLQIHVSAELDDVVILAPHDVTYASVAVRELIAIHCKLGDLLDRGLSTTDACSIENLSAVLRDPSATPVATVSNSHFDRAFAAAAVAPVVSIFSKNAAEEIVLWTIDRSPCPPGHASTLLACNPCPAGTYLPTGGQKCTVCPAGTFASDIASTSCTPCAGPGTCYPGSTADTSLSQTAIAPQRASSLRRNETTAFEPTIFAFAESNFRNPEYVNETTFVLVIVWAVIAGIVILVFFVFTVVSSRTNIEDTSHPSLMGRAVAALAACDIFFRVSAKTVPAADAPNDDGLKARARATVKVLMQHRSPLGGVLALVTMLGLVVVILALSLKFSMDNATITPSQRPSGIAPGATFTLPRIRVTVDVYGVDTERNCIANDTTSCASNIAVTAANVAAAESTSSSCSVPQQSICRVSWLCEACTLVETPQVNVDLGSAVPFVRNTLVAVELARSDLAFGVEGGSSRVEFFLAPSTANRVFQKSPPAPPASILSFVGYAMQTVDYRASESNPSRTLGYGVTEGRLELRGSEVNEDNIVFVPSPGATAITVRILPASFHTITEVRQVQSFLAFAGVVGGAASALLGIGTLVVKSIERFRSWRKRSSKDEPGSRLSTDDSDDYTLLSSSASLSDSDSPASAHPLKSSSPAAKPSSPAAKPPASKASSKTATPTSKAKAKAKAKSSKSKL
ncbi:uncharacterized protein AMSG_08584 [Thecamonas trahens ATCC 50062]|uniref:Tyrosine-protein kinase ephrin type A/B receptor-like domain-containing protein n=1 Tax=Thecamonas trahens ATCC 50062 TaxID=461836 RepID=A0A0L0DL08_THETB|nr:hypothetical protein AMSG_08584 [Thecamonas trahens ATCC 50062]KNC52706.1 hypothetical protein AMSG_08584 [Thecamonas trahens ATCC 50062]|eukprot:XP_013755026.1 hypothetical protein AMSG_08584 [Thecamonas trahens ATCC 50062]